MKIELHKIPVREAVDGFQNNAIEGVVAYGGKLDIRPPYQRIYLQRQTTGRGY